LWSLGEGNVKAVRQIVAESRPLAYTTIMTVLDRLVRKGMLVRRKVGRSFTYKPQATRDAARVLGYDYGAGDRLAKLIPDPQQGRPPSFEDCLKQGEQLRALYDVDAHTGHELGRFRDRCAPAPWIDSVRR